MKVIDATAANMGNGAAECGHDAELALRQRIV
jgi:hypothetical protein